MGTVTSRLTLDRLHAVQPGLATRIAEEFEMQRPGIRVRLEEDMAPDLIAVQGDRYSERLEQLTGS